MPNGLDLLKFALFKIKYIMIVYIKFLFLSVLFQESVKFVFDDTVQDKNT